MRAPKNEATGTSGESEVLAQFERLGWAGVIDSRHDTGTDLYLRPRDARRYELGAVMGAQVKTGPSYFASPHREPNGTITGWWFDKADQKHFDYWVRHALPHVLILRDQETNRSYWVHVTSDQVISTGEGVKILVPMSQTIDDEHNTSLSDVALTQLPSPIWDGTAWTGAVHLSPADEIRHALITPRLIAPHPNLAPASISGVEALAMQVLLRRDLERILEPVKIPGFTDDDHQQTKGLSLGEASKSDNWSWRATAALHHWHYNDDPQGLVNLLALASTAEERAAATVLCCAYHFDKNDPDTALEVIQDALNHDDYMPVDYAWLESQRARSLLEIGQQQAAFDLAMKTQRIHREVPADATAGAIAGACALTSFKATDWMKGDISEMIQRNDTPASWWRNQVTLYGLSAHLSQRFRIWSEDLPNQWTGPDDAQRYLLSAALIASCTADQDGWRSATGMLAKHSLINAEPTDQADAVANGLTLLRFSGESKSIAHATRNIVRKGPTLAARIAASGVDLSHSTRTTALADIELLTAAGNVLESKRADQICMWALATLRDPHTYFERIRPTFFASYKLIKMLISILPVLSEEILYTVLEYCLASERVNDSATTQELARLIHAVPETAWTESHRQRAAELSKTASAYLREAYLAVSAPTVPESQEEIFQRAGDGDLSIFDAITDVRDLPSDAVISLINRLCKDIDSLVENASRGLRLGGGLDSGHALSILNVWHPHNARWDHVETLLSASPVSSTECSGALKILAVHGSKVPDKIKKQLIEHVLRLREQIPIPSVWGEDQDIRAQATEAFAALTDESSRGHLIRELLGGDAAHRAASARIIERYGDKAEEELLMALAGDTNLAVRQAALAGLSNLVANGCTSNVVMCILSKELQSGGTQGTSAIVSRLTSSSERATVSDLLAVAANHPSARVRNAANKT